VNVLLFAVITIMLQTSTPTPTPARFMPLQFATVASPTPIPSSTPFEMPTGIVSGGDIYNYLATAERNLAGAPDSLAGNALLSEDGRILFSYAKWVFNPNITEEIFGVFAPIPNVIAIILALVLIIVAAYFTVFVVVRIGKFIIWLIMTAKSFIPFLGAFILQIPPTPTPYPTVSPIDNPFTLPVENTKLWAYADDAIQSWNMIPSQWTLLLQGIVLLLMILGGIWMIATWARGMSESDRGGKD
jgi:hypothetical protein